MVWEELPRWKAHMYVHMEGVFWCGTKSAVNSISCDIGVSDCLQIKVTHRETGYVVALIAC